MTQTWLVDAYLAENVGDDLMLLELFESNPEMVFLLPEIPAMNTARFASIPNVRLLSRSKLWMRKAFVSGVVMIGGSMFMDRRGRTVLEWFRHRRMYVGRLFLALAMRSTGRRYYVVGANIGPVETMLGKLTFQAILAVANGVSVRDKASHSLLFRPSNADLAPDMVFSWVERWKSRNTVNPLAGVVGVSVMELPSWSFGSVYEESLREIIRRLVSCEDVSEVRLFAFQGGAAGDVEMADRLAMDTARGGVSVVAYSGDAEKFVRELAACEFLVGTRFHAVVLGLALKLKLSVVSYSSKIDQMLGDLAWPHAVRHVSDDRDSLVDGVLGDLSCENVYEVNTRDACRHARLVSDYT